MEAKTETNASILALRFFESGSALHVARMVDTLPDARLRGRAGKRVCGEQGRASVAFALLRVAMLRGRGRSS
eukprot:3857946-Prymnesium_polylepis.1